MPVRKFKGRISGLNLSRGDEMTLLLREKRKTSYPVKNCEVVADILIHMISIRKQFRSKKSIKVNPGKADNHTSCTCNV